MVDYEKVPSAICACSAFKRLASGKTAVPSAQPARTSDALGCLWRSVFNQVQSSPAVARGGGCEPRLAVLEDSVKDNTASACALHSLFDISREIRDANIGASAASVQQVEAAAMLADELRRRIVAREGAAAEPHAPTLSAPTAERLLRS
jgi:hypothetical protein